MQRGTETVERWQPLQRRPGTSDRHRAARDSAIVEFRPARALRSHAFAGQVERRLDTTPAVFRYGRPGLARAKLLVVRRPAQRQAQHRVADGFIRRGTCVP